MPEERKPGNLLAPALYTSSSCMDLGQYREDDVTRTRRPSRGWHTVGGHRQQGPAGQQPHSSPLPQAEWTGVPSAYRPQHWVDPNETSPVATRQTARLDPMSAWRPRPSAPATSTSDQTSERSRRQRAPKIFRRRDAEESTRPQAVDVTRLYPQMSPYDENRMSVYSAPEHMERAHIRFASQPNSPAFPPPSWSAMPSGSDEPSPTGLPRSPTYPPAGRRRMHSETGVGDAAFEDEEDFRLFVEATAGLPPDVGFSFTKSGQSPTQPSESPIRRAATVQGTGRSEMSPVAETPNTVFALREMAAIPQSNQTYRPQRAQTRPQRQSPPRQNTQRHVQRPPATRSDSSRERIAASASGLDLWLPSQSPVSPQSAHPTLSSQTHTLPRRPVGSAGPLVSPLTPASSHFQGLDREIEQQLEELDLQGVTDGDAGLDDELPDYAQSQAEAQAERRAEAAKRAQELQERWLRRGR